MFLYQNVSFLVSKEKNNSVKHKIVVKENEIYLLFKLKVVMYVQYSPFENCPLIKIFVNILIVYVI